MSDSVLEALANLLKMQQLKIYVIGSLALFKSELLSFENTLNKAVCKSFKRSLPYNFMFCVLY